MNEQRTFFGRMLDAVARTGYDMPYRERFLADPRKTLAEEGVDVPEDIAIELIMDNPSKLHLVIPVFDDAPVILPADHPLLAPQFDPDK